VIGGINKNLFEIELINKLFSEKTDEEAAAAKDNE
jgi:hypothetical protein